MLGGPVTAIPVEPNGGFSLLQKLLPCCCKRAAFGALVITNHRIINVFTFGKSRSKGAKYLYAADYYFFDSITSGYSEGLPIDRRLKGCCNRSGHVLRYYHLRTNFGPLTLRPVPPYRINFLGCLVSHTAAMDSAVAEAMQTLTRLNVPQQLPRPDNPPQGVSALEVCWFPTCAPIPSLSQYFHAYALPWFSVSPLPIHLLV